MEIERQVTKVTWVHMRRMSRDLKRSMGTIVIILYGGNLLRLP